MNVSKLDSLCFLIKVTLPSACRVHWVLTPGYGGFARGGGREGKASHPFRSYPTNGGEGGPLWCTGLREKEMWFPSLSVPCQLCGFGQDTYLLPKEAVRSDILLKGEELLL